MKTDVLIDQPLPDAPDMAPDERSPAPPESPAGFIRKLLAMPLYYKVLITNSAIVVLGALAGTTITLQVARAYPDARLYVPLCLLFTGAGLLLSMLLNGLLLRAAFQPLKSLRATASQVGLGDLTVRARLSALADGDMRALARTLNSVLDDVEGYRAQMQALAGRVIRAQEEERRRIARELHDDTGQTLTLLLVRLKLLENGADAEARQNEIAALRGLVSAAIDRVRQLALDLRPPALDHLGLAASLRSLVRQVKETTHLSIALELPDGPIALSPERAIAVYRIVQEALTNILKHGQAQQVQVKLARQAGQLLIRVADDGRGFDLRGLERLRRQDTDGRGLGLFGMMERAHLAGGRFSIESHPGRGTTVQVTVPLEVEVADGQAAHSAG
jgi:two-component system, NarL family, sensor histidine kinase UhpB